MIQWHDAFYVTYQSSRISHTRVHSSIHSSAFGILFFVVVDDVFSVIIHIFLRFFFFLLFSLNGSTLYAAVWLFLFSFYLFYAQRVKSFDPATTSLSRDRTSYSFSEQQNWKLTKNAHLKIIHIHFEADNAYVFLFFFFSSSISFL